MKLLLTLALLVSGAGVWAQTTNDIMRELQQPRRVVNGITVDVSPLMRWHLAGAQGPRPLKPWEFVQGTPVATNGMGWKLSAIVGSNTVPIQIVLRNPPKSQQDTFNRIKSQHAALERRHQQLTAKYQAALDYYKTTEANFRRQSMLRFSGDALDLAYADAESLREQVEATAAQLKAFDWQGQDPSRGFVFRGYVVRTGLLFEKAPVFDYGTPLR
jgi:hypothetical protein